VLALSVDVARKRTRARRFTLHSPVRYRTRDGRWRRGTTENMSRSGILLRTEDDDLSLHVPVELVIELPPTLGDEAASIVCEGEIVRTASDESAGSLFAASIDRYKFTR
jgi:hypothetical protein